MALLASCGEPLPDIDALGRLSEAELAQAARGRELQPRAGAIRFGFDRRSSFKEDARQYLPLLRYLEEATGSAFELHVTPARSSIVEELRAGDVQLAAIGAGTFIEARVNSGVVPLVRGVGPDDTAGYRSVIVTAPGSDIREIADLRGKRFAFGSYTSTQGHLIPRILLSLSGLRLADLGGYEHASSHLEVARAVSSGRAQAGAMQDTLGQELAAAGLLRIIHTSPEYPSSGIVAAPNLDPAVRGRVKSALLDFDPLGKDATGLHDWHKTEMPRGFAEARIEDYAELETWSRRLGVFGGEGSNRP